MLRTSPNLCAILPLQMGVCPLLLTLAGSRRWLPQRLDWDVRLILGGRPCTQGVGGRCPSCESPYQARGAIIPLSCSKWQFQHFKRQMGKRTSRALCSWSNAAPRQHLDTTSLPASSLVSGRENAHCLKGPGLQSWPCLMQRLGADSRGSRTVVPTKWRYSMILVTFFGAEIGPRVKFNETTLFCLAFY